MTRAVAHSFALLLIFATARGAGSPTPRHPLTYPWHDHITTTVFWMGEGSNQVTSGLNWVPNHDGGNAQPPPDAGRLNPYYAALPFNDLMHPDLADKWLPAGWPRPRRSSNGWTTIRTQNGRPIRAKWEPRSACLGHWIEIKNAKGQICFARWEDVGPVRDDDAPYVFGTEHPTAPLAGLDVSPAVAKRLGIDRSASLSWRFVDDQDVKEGPWLDRDGGQVLIASPGL